MAKSGDGEPLIPTERPHPEDYCDRCSSPNVIWASEKWHNVYEVPEEAPNILCILCFSRDYVEKMGKYPVWNLRLLHEYTPDSYDRIINHDLGYS